MGIGASAGGLDALERFFANIPAATSMAFVVAQHLSPDHKSMMVDLLGKRTKLVVREAEDGAPIEAGTVYLVPPRANVLVGRGLLTLSDRAAPHTLNLPVDQLLRSLADSYGERAIAVVLSGTGSDGREGVMAIKSAGGVVLAQEPTTARFDGMPREAIRTGLVDLVLSPEEMATELGMLGDDRRLLAKLAARPEPESAFERVAEELRRTHGFDLSKYKRTTTLRRLERRLTARGVGDLDEYAQVLEDDPTEGGALIQELLINVTQFFRDREVFDAVAGLLPRLQAQARHEALRVWVPGCASGEEVYSLAMVLAEAEMQFKLFGTDVDDQALAQATSAVYRDDALRGVSPARLERFFVRRDSGYEIDRELRKRVVFAPHNLLADPPFTRMDMVSCRNVLIYLTPEAQRRVLDSFAFALRPGGVLVLGTSEVLGDRIDDFKPLDAHLKIFARREGRKLPPPLVDHVKHVAIALPRDDDQATMAALRLLVDRVAPAAILVDERLRLLRVFGNAGKLLALGVGEPSLDVLSLLPDAVRAVTSVAAHRALASNEEVGLVAVHEASEVAAVRAIPFELRAPAGRYAVLVFEGRPATSSPTAPVDVSQVETLERELDAARQSLQAAVEELETSNEELQATNEELLASNEELQSTNEELQSVNEELHTVNVEHQLRITELSETNADLDNLLNATPIATVFLDDKLRLRRFNPAVTGLFPLVEADRGRPLAHFTSQLLASPLTPELERVLAQAQAVEREVATVTGQRFYMRAVPHVGARRRVCGVVLTFSDVTALYETRQSQDLLQSVIDALQSHVAVVDDAGIIQFVNSAWLDFARANGAGSAGVSVGASYLEACRDVPEIRTSLEAVLRGQRSFFTCEYPCDSPTEKWWYIMHVHRTRDGRRTVVSHTDITRAQPREAPR